MESAFGERARQSGIKVERAKLTAPRQACGLNGLTNGSPSRILGYYAGSEIPTDQQLRCVTIGAAGARLMTTDALLNPAGIRALASSRSLVTSAAQDPCSRRRQGSGSCGVSTALPPAPGRYAAYGYEAMAVVLDSIRRAGDSGADRDSVVSAFFNTVDRRSILGSYSIDDVGDTTLSRLAGTGWSTAGRCSTPP